MGKDFTPLICNLNIEILKAHHMILDNRWKHDNLYAPFTRLYFVKSGQGYIKQGDKKLDIQDEHVYLIPGDRAVSLGCTHLEKIWFHIRLNGTEKNDLFSIYPTIDSLPFTLKSFEQLSEALYSNDNILFLSVYTFLYETMFAFAAKQKPPISAPAKDYSELTTMLLREIRERPCATLTTKELADRLFVSPSKAHVTFRNEVGMTIKKYIDDVVFAEAKKLLSDPSLSIATISAQLGFCDRYYFSTRFKEVCGITPAAYRRITLLNA